MVDTINKTLHWNNLVIVGNTSIRTYETLNRPLEHIIATGLTFTMSSCGSIIRTGIIELQYSSLTRSKSWLRRALTSIKITPPEVSPRGTFSAPRFELRTCDDIVNLRAGCCDCNLTAHVLSIVVLLSVSYGMEQYVSYWMSWQARIALSWKNIPW